MAVTIRPALSADADAIYNIHVSSIQQLCCTHYEQGQILTWAGRQKVERYVSLIRYFNKFLKMNKTRTFMHSLKEQIECIKNMLLPRKTDYYFKSYNVSNITSLVTNNVRDVNGPRYKKL